MAKVARTVLRRFRMRGARVVSEALGESYFFDIFWRVPCSPRNPPLSLGQFACAGHHRRRPRKAPEALGASYFFKLF